VELLMKSKRLSLMLVLFAVAVLGTPVGFSAPAARPTSAHHTVARQHRPVSSPENATSAWGVLEHILKMLQERFQEHHG
jgi:hypothetical protein